MTSIDSVLLALKCTNGRKKEKIRNILFGYPFVVTGSIMGSLIQILMLSTLMLRENDPKLDPSIDSLEVGVEEQRVLSSYHKPRQGTELTRFKCLEEHIKRAKPCKFCSFSRLSALLRYLQ